MPGHILVPQRFSIDVIPEMETSGLIISRHSLFHCMCGGGNSRYMPRLEEKGVCEKCTDRIGAELVRSFRCRWKTVDQRAASRLSAPFPA